jgi:hypothetical protein
MRLTIPHRERLIFSLFLILMNVNGALFANDSDYLEAIKADYEEFDTGVFIPPPGSSWVSTRNNGSGLPSLSHEKLEDFSSFLREESPGSFIFFDKLPKQYQTQLHQNYLETGNLDEIKKNIFKYSSELKKQK